MYHVHVHAHARACIHNGRARARARSTSTSHAYIHDPDRFRRDLSLDPSRSLSKQDGRQSMWTFLKIVSIFQEKLHRIHGPIYDCGKLYVYFLNMESLILKNTMSMVYRKVLNDIHFERYLESNPNEVNNIMTIDRH